MRNRTGKLVAWSLSLLGLLACPGVMAQPAARPDAELVVQARDAWRSKDRKRLDTLNAVARQQQDPLAAWVDYFDLNARLTSATQPELDAFYARWPGSYVEDRLRNDWLLELGRRQQWEDFRRDHAGYKMRDDRELACYALLADHLAGQRVADAARPAWLAQKNGDDGCHQLATAMVEAGAFKPDLLWLKARLATEGNRPRAARQAVSLLDSKGLDQRLAELQDNAGRYLTRKARTTPHAEAELTALALARVAASNPDQAADLLREKWGPRLPVALQGWLWGQIGRQSALRLQDDASSEFERAFKLHAEPATKRDGRDGRSPDMAAAFSDDLLAWAARAALRSRAWPQVLQAISRMSSDEQRDPAWVYWRARALTATGKADEARPLLLSIASPLTFFGRLAAEETGQSTALPAAPAPLTAEERHAAQTNPGLARALRLIDAGLRAEGVREWNFSLRGMSDRALLAAAQLACEREVWDRCINTSERSKTEIDIAQRYPTPYRTELLAQARETGLDPAYVYGLIRQESRFVHDARSHVGAAGLMQVMPATARWTARKAGLAYAPARLSERDFNLRIGTTYLKLVLDGFDGAQVLAAAAYNAGPSRPRRWREGPVLDAAIWAENIPFNETRDYVRRVLVNGAIYAQILGLPAGRDGASLRQRLGATVGPAKAGAGDTPPDAAADAP